MKIKAYLASYSVLIEIGAGTEYVAMSRDADGVADEVVCETAEEAAELSANTGIDNIWFKRPKRAQRMHHKQSEEVFITKSGATAWVERCQAHMEDTEKVIHFRYEIKEIVIDTEEFDEYKPKYEVECVVKIERRIYVEVDAAEHDLIKDEYDAENHVKDAIDMGDYDNEIQQADDEDVEIYYVDATEQ